MVYSGKCVIQVNVFEVKTFDRKSGNKGQEIVVQTDRGYRCSVSAVDVNVCDFTSIKGVTDLVIEPFIDYDHFQTKDGKSYAKNYASFRIVGLG